MPKFARLVVPGYPHHVTQRGIRRQQTFFSDADYGAYLELVRKCKVIAAVDILAYCLMPNHVHIIAVPENSRSLARLFGPVHHRYAQRVNAINDWRGHLWQQRFYSVVMDENQTLAAMKYVEMNPVRAGLCKRADEWPWSSVHANLGERDDEIVDESEVRQVIADWSEFLTGEGDSEFVNSLRAQTSTGRPTGDDDFVESLEQKTGRRIRRRRPGPIPKS